MPGTLKKLVKQPILGFFVIGTVLFLLARESDRVVVDAELKEQLAAQWIDQMGSEPTQRELESLVQRWVEEELLYREALHLGLDDNDSIVRRRLVQKARFYGRLADREVISDATVKKHYEDNKFSYSESAKLSFSQILISSESEYVATRHALDNGETWSSLGEDSLLPRVVNKQSSESVRAAFGERFVQELLVIDTAAIDSDEWVGPITSAFGIHLVNVKQRTKPRFLPFEEVEDQVRADLYQLHEAAALDRFYQRLRNEYQVEYR